MRLLYLSYWGLEDVLTQATVLPHLEILEESQRVESLLFASVERQNGSHVWSAAAGSRIRHVPLLARRLRPRILAKMVDFVELPNTLARLCREEGVTHLLARGAPAGALAHLLQRHRRIPYVVESFEPHAEYMRESGVWAAWDPRYLFQRHWEAAQLREATALLPVTDSFRQVLLEQGVPASRVVTLPCTVDTERFRFSAEQRRQARVQLSVTEGETLGVYAGKFGDIYYAEEAFLVFARFAQRIPGFRMLVLTPMQRESIEAMARAAGYPADRLSIVNARHDEVPGFLCGADLGFATIRPAPSRRFCSPVKIGEYWACGLPVVITEGIGDDTRIIREFAAGAVIDLTENLLAPAIDRLRELIAEPRHRERIAVLARRFRARSRIREAYERIGFV